MLQETIDSWHFAELMAEERIKPRGQERVESMLGAVAATVANCHRDSSKRSKPFTHTDFLLLFGEREDGGRMTEEEIAQTLAAWVAVTNNGDDRQPGGEADGEHGPVRG